MICDHLTLVHFSRIVLLLAVILSSSPTLQATNKYINMHITVCSLSGRRWTSFCTWQQLLIKFLFNIAEISARVHLLDLNLMSKYSTFGQLEYRTIFSRNLNFFHYNLNMIDMNLNAHLYYYFLE